MASGETRAILRRYLRRLLEVKMPAKGLVRYGSHARGDARATSDIDVLVLLDDSLSDQQILRLWPELELLRIGIDTRIETWRVTVSHY